MSASAYQTAVLELDGATGANGESLVVLRHFALDETNTSGAATDAKGNANGTYISSPTSTASGPLMTETDGGRSVTMDGSTDYVKCGVNTDLINALNNEGLTVLVWRKRSVATAAVKAIFGWRDPAAKNSFFFGFDMNTLGNNSAGSFGVHLDDNSGSNYKGVQYDANDARHSDGAWHCDEVFARVSTAEILVYFDTIQPTMSAPTSSGTLGALATGTTEFMIGGYNIGTSFFPVYAGLVGHVSIIRGKLTQAQRRRLFLAASYNANGVPVRTARFNPSMSVMKSDLAETTNAHDGDGVAVIYDVTSNGNKLVAPFDTDVSMPTLQRAYNWDIACLNFDNYYCDDVGGNQQILRTASSTPTLPKHLGVIVVTRVLTTIQVNAQPIQEGMYVAGITDGSYTANGALYVAGLSIAPNGSDRVNHVAGASVLTPVNGNTTAGQQAMPAVRCLPGCCIMGFTVGADGVHGSPTPRLYMNRFKANASGAVAGGTPLTAKTGIFMGGIAQAGDGMFIGRIEDLIITTPFTDAEFLAFAEAYMALVGETLNPRNHVVVSGDSIDSLRAATFNRNRVGLLPSGARQNTSWCNAATGSARLSGSVNVDMDERGFDSAKFWDPNATNWLLQCAGYNDHTPDNKDGATLDSRLQNVLDSVSAGQSTSSIPAANCKVAVYGLLSPPATANSNRTDYHNLVRARVGDTVDVFIEPNPAGAELSGDGIHPTTAGQQVAANDIWDQWGRLHLGSSGLLLLF